MATQFGLTMASEEPWLLEAELQRQHRTKGASLSGVLTVVDTMIGIRHRNGWPTRALKEYRRGTLRLDPGPENQAVPATRMDIQSICATLPFHLALPFWLMWKTASRAGDILGLQGRHLHWGPDPPEHPLECAITWLQLSKSGKSNPWCIRNTTHLRVSPSDPFGCQAMRYLRSVENGANVFRFADYEQLVSVLRMQGSPLNRLSGHSFKRGASDEVNRNIVPFLPQLPMWVPSLLLKHNTAAEATIPSQSVRYAEDKLALVRRTRTGELTLRL